MTVADFLERAELGFASDPGVVDEPDQPGAPVPESTYGRFAERVRAWQAGLDALGVGEGERVAVVGHNSARLLELLFAVPMSGRICVPVNFRLSPDEVAYVVEQSGASVLLVAWLLATVVERSPFDSLARAVRGSGVLTTIDSGMPDDVRNTFSDLRRLVDENVFPEVFAGLRDGRIVDVAAPDVSVVSTPGVQEASASIVKVTGVAPSCGRRVEGTGFVYSPQRVMTNAHVVAGVTEAEVEIDGRSMTATVVVFDPDRDVAVLYVPDLRRPPLRFQTSPPGQSGDAAVVAGYPQDGPYTLEAARIRNRQSANAPDIYSRGTVRRDFFAIRGQVLPGNSGGPLLSPTGTVYGVVFAAARDDGDTGYVLTANEVSVPAQAGAQATSQVSTQGCD